ncbi:hypothetical protein ACWGH3_39105 [Streptomyces sp. NPDC054884]
MRSFSFLCRRCRPTSARVGTELARPPLSAEQAREMTAGLREAMDDVRRSVPVLAARDRDAATWSSGSAASR